ncbi:MAG: hypothetical protein WCI05_18730, partial [Myxococcales bacterium]
MSRESSHKKVPMHVAHDALFETLVAPTESPKAPPHRRPSSPSTSPLLVHRSALLYRSSVRIPRCHLPVAFLTLIVACSAVDGPAPAVAPVNVCPEYACSAYRPYTPGLAAAQCNSGACVVSAHIDYLLVVSLPETSFYAPNQSFVLASGTLFDRPTASCPTRTCARLPEVGVVVGNYVIAPRVSEEQVRYYLGNGLGQPAALPIDVVYRPLWNLAATSIPVARVGLPLLSVHAWPITVLAGTPGPARGPSPGSRTQIAAGLYERTIMPTAPFDTAFPPNV